MKDDLQAQRVAAAHARYWNLLPWWVNGTLSSDEASGIEQHLVECAECAVELELQRALQSQVRDGDPVLMAPQSAWQKMAERLDNEDEALARGHFKLRTEGAGVWPWAVAAQALLIVGLTTVIWQQTRLPARSPDSQAVLADAMLQPRYETLTSVANVATTSGVVRVVFRNDTTLLEVSTVLRDLSAQIVGGPSEAGVYMLALTASAANPSRSPEPAADMLKRLRADARVIFAEPVEHR